MTTHKQHLWTWGDTALIFIVFFIVYGLSVPLQFAIADLTGELAEFERSDNPSIPASALLVNHIGKAIGLVGGVLYVGLFRHNYSWAQLGFKPTSRRWLIVSVLIGVIAVPVRLLLAKGVVALMPEFERGAAGIFLNNSYSPAFNLLLLAIITVLVPVSEELFYRGFLFRWFRSRRPLWSAVLFSSIIFGMSHLIPIQIAMSIVLSITITLVYHRSDSLWNAIAIHAVNNFISALLALSIS